MRILPGPPLSEGPKPVAEPRQGSGQWSPSVGWLVWLGTPSTHVARTSIPWPTRSKLTSILAVPWFSVSTRHPSCGDAYSNEITCAWHETDNDPPASVHVVTTGVAEAVGVVDSVSVAVGVADVVGVPVGSALGDASSEPGSDVVSVGPAVAVVVAPVCADVGVGLWVALAASSRSPTWGAERMLVDEPSRNTATACHTTRLVTRVASTHDAAAMAAMRCRDLFVTPQS